MSTLVKDHFSLSSETYFVVQITHQLFDREAVKEIKPISVSVRGDNGRVAQRFNNHVINNEKACDRSRSSDSLSKVAWSGRARIFRVIYECQDKVSSSKARCIKLIPSHSKFSDFAPAELA